MINKIYEDVLNIPAVSGNEDLLRKYMKEFIEKYQNFEIKYDNLGSIFGVKKSNNKNAKTVIIAGHMDEVGFMVANITENGHIKLQPLGGFVSDVLISQVLNIYTENDIIPGVVGSLPPHLKQANKTNISDFLLDVGASSKSEAESFGIKPGQMVLFNNQFTHTKNNKRVISKAVDNRFGVGLALETIKHFNDVELEINLVVGATVQEEVGLRGAQTATKMFKPDVFIALDASPVNDLTSNEVPGLGKGFLMRLFDPRNVMHQGLIKFFRETALENNIKYQDFTSKGGTDAAAALDELSGVLSTTIGLPARYIHSTAAMMDLDDLAAAKEMLFAVINKLDSNVIEKIKGGYND
ncbi:MAG TPA: M42 family metallopeptidase [Acholeplasmataceae bacterium]|nr:M42 family metallopeptidase [Acholeplasmataceae bacterium]